MRLSVTPLPYCSCLIHRQKKVRSVFVDIAAHRLFGANLAMRGQTQNGQGLFVSGSDFPLLGVQPAIGRLLGEADDKSIGGSFVVVLGHVWWQSRFGQDPGVLGQTLVVNGQAGSAGRTRKTAKES